MDEDKIVKIYYVTEYGDIKYWSWEKNIIEIYLSIINRTDLKIKVDEGTKRELASQYVKGHKREKWLADSEIILAQFDTFDHKGNKKIAYAPIVKSDNDEINVNIDSYFAHEIDYSTIYSYLPHINRTYSRAFKDAWLNNVIDYIVTKDIPMEDDGYNESALPKRIDVLKYYSDYLAESQMIEKNKYK